MDFNQLINFTTKLGELELVNSVNSLCKYVIDDIDVEALMEDESFQQVLRLCIAAKAAGVTLHA